MKKLIGIFAAMVMMITAYGQKDDVRYENGWVNGSIKETVGIYYAPDKSGKNYAVALKIEIDSVYFNGKNFYVDASKCEKNKDVYVFLVFDVEGNTYEITLRGDTYPKYHKYFVTIEGDNETMYGVLIKNVTLGLVQEAKWKQAWFDRMYSGAENKTAIASK